MVLAICGGQVMANTLAILPEIEEQSDVKIVAVTSPQLYEELRRTDPKKAAEILSDEERQYVVALHNGWRGFLYPFLLPADYAERVFGMDEFSRSGKPDEIYRTPVSTPPGCGKNSCVREKKPSSPRSRGTTETSAEKTKNNWSTRPAARVWRPMISCFSAVGCCSPALLHITRRLGESRVRRRSRSPTPR